MEPAPRTAIEHITEPEDRAMTRHGLASPFAREAVPRVMVPRVSNIATGTGDGSPRQNDFSIQLPCRPLMLSLPRRRRRGTTPQTTRKAKNP